MKIKLFLAPLLALSLGGMTLHSIASHPDDQDDNRQGGTIHGHEAFEAKIIFTATENAPVGASGVAHLEVENEDGTETNQLSLKTRGLTPGDYILTAVTKSDSSVATIGQITISTSDDSEDGDDHNEDGNQHDSEKVKDDHMESSHHSHEVETESEVELPLTLDPLDIAQLILSDSNGNPILVADLVNPALNSAMNFRAVVEVIPGETAPEATGKAVMRVKTKKNKHTERFTLVAKNLSPRTTFDVVANDTTITSVISNSKGKVLVKQLSTPLSLVHSVKLVDAEGNTAASANF